MLLRRGILHLWQTGFVLSSPAAWPRHIGHWETAVAENSTETEEGVEESPESSEDQEGSNGAAAVGDDDDAADAMEEELEESTESLNTTPTAADAAADFLVEKAADLKPWFLREEISDPPGFAHFRQQMLSVQAQGMAKPDSVKWVVFSASIGLGNWMAGLSSAFLVAGLTGRAFAWIPASMHGVCTWMDSPLCEWAEHPAQVLGEAEKILEAMATNPRSKHKSRSVEVLAIDWKGCKYEKLRHKQITDKPILLMLSGVWVGNVLLENPDFHPIMQQAFQRNLVGHGQRERAVGLAANCRLTEIVPVLRA